MAIDPSKLVGVGTTANDNTGDPLRDAFVKINNNFTELYIEPSISLVGNILTLTRPDDSTSTVDLAPYLDEDARAISSGTLSGGIVTFTRDDASTFTLDLSDLLDNTNIVTSVNTQTGAVVLDADDIDDTSTTNKFTSSADISKLAGIEAGAEVNTVDSVAGKTGVVTLVKGDVGLGNVDNTSDANKPISTATQTALNLKYDASNPAGYTSNVGDITSVVAGDGLTGGATDGDATLNVVGGDGITANADEVEVTVDDSTIELSATDGTGAVRVKDLGITNAKISASAAIDQSKLNMTAATTRANATGIAQSDLGLASFDSNQFTLTNGWATVTTIDGGVYS